MKVEQILQLIDAVSASELTEFKYEEDGVKLSLKKTNGKEVTMIPAAPIAPASLPAAPAPAAASAAAPLAAPASAAETSPAGNVVKSPLVGTFYAAPAEDAAPFVKVGDSVKEGQVLAIVEAMKLMNEIESDYDCEIEAVLVSNEQKVEYGQPLFKVKKLSD